MASAAGVPAAAWKYCGLKRGSSERSGVSWFDKYDTSAGDFETVWWYLCSYAAAEGCLCLLRDGTLEGFFCETTEDVIRAKLVGRWSKSEGNYTLHVDSIAVSTVNGGAPVSVTDSAEAPACWAAMQTSQFVVAADASAPSGLPFLSWSGVFTPHDRYQLGSRVIHGN